MPLPNVPLTHTDSAAHRRLIASLLNSLNPVSDTLSLEIVGTTTPGTATYVTDGQVGRYTKLGGNLIRFSMYLNWSAHTGAGNMEITGLPETALNVSEYYHAVTIRENSITMTAGNTIKGFISPGTTAISLSQHPAGGGPSAAIPIDTAGSIIVSGIYEY